MPAHSLFSAMRRMLERGILRKRIGTGSGHARCCCSPLAEHLILQKYVDLRPLLFPLAQDEPQSTKDNSFSGNRKPFAVGWRHKEQAGSSLGRRAREVRGGRENSSPKICSR